MEKFITTLTTQGPIISGVPRLRYILPLLLLVFFVVHCVLPLRATYPTSTLSGPHHSCIFSPLTHLLDLGPYQTRLHVSYCNHATLEMALMTHRSTSTTTLNTTCSTTTSVLDPASVPPPTYNHLDAVQRSRLIRSSRKLGKVLGTTPCILENVPPPLPTSSSTASITDVASKRCSVPPPSKSAFADFAAAIDSGGSNRSRKPSLISDGGTESYSSHLAPVDSSTTNFIQHRKASSDALGPLPTILDSEGGRHKSKRSQPILRIPPTVSNNNAFVLSLPSDSSTSFSLFSSEYTLDSTRNVVDPVRTPLPLSPTTSFSPASTGTTKVPPPTTPTGESPEEAEAAENSSPEFPEGVLEYPGLSPKDDEARLRKRRMEKLMRHLGEYVPSELVSGSAPAPAREAKTFSFSGGPPHPPPTSSAPLENGNSRFILSKAKDAQSRVMRRVSVISGQLRRPYENENENDGAVNAGCFSDPEPGNTPRPRIHAGLLRERSKIHIARKEGRAKEKPLVEDDWTPEAYEDVVKRLRQLK